MNESEVIAQLVNEYAAVSVLLDRATAGPRIVLRAERTGGQVALDPVMLEALASLDAASLRALVAAFSETGAAGDVVQKSDDQAATGQSEGSSPA